MRHISELMTEVEDAVLRVTGADAAYWADHFTTARRVARISGAVRPGQLFTANQMFGIVIDGRYVTKGWKQKLGLDDEEIKCVQAELLQNELTEHERELQEAAGRSPKNKTSGGTTTIKRAVRYTISDSFFEPPAE